ncbi:MAG: hypothetical protein KatS3mg019_1599 [Fimbriimonadales bacterium]|nr:MAG: hypothetical protein KatS3mg019_1599 [Fimbriimonadales bacterium]
MFCRGNTGDSAAVVSGQGERSLLFLLVGFLVLIGLSFAMQACVRKQAPWFGRDRNLPRAPIRVLTGPIDWRCGIPNVLALQMSQTEVEKRLGKPLIRALSTEEALQEGLDPENVMDYFYGGVFAWVLYDASGKVLSIKFDLKSLKAWMGIDQSLLLVVQDKSFLISRNTSRASVVNFLKSAGHVSLEEQPYAITVRFGDGKVFGIDFDESQHVESVSIII